MQITLDSLFARPGSAPIGGGKKREFRDWTNRDRNAFWDKLVYSWVAQCHAINKTSNSSH